MDGLDRVALQGLMARMAAGEVGAAFELHETLGWAVRASVGRIARSMGAHHLSAEELDGLTLDVCIELIKLAPSWDAEGGALPWVWANRRVVALVAAHIGQYGPSFDDALHGDVVADRGPTDDDRPDEETLARLAETEPLVAVLLEALLAVTSERNLRAVLLYAVQQAQGDPSPSHTVGETLGLRPDNVRQIVHRTRRGLQALMARDDSRYGQLEQLAFLGLAEAA
jgi:DNA-directed RNA polymerase specialized sigma24 family protein